MAQSFAMSFYKSPAWLKCRRAVISLSLGLCARCKRPGSIVHHKIKLTPDNIHDHSITLDMANLELLCVACHNMEHGGALPVRENLFFTADGDIVEAPHQFNSHANLAVPARQKPFLRGRQQGDV